MRQAAHLGGELRFCDERVEHEAIQGGRDSLPHVLEKHSVQDLAEPSQIDVQIVNALSQAWREDSFPADQRCFS